MNADGSGEEESIRTGPTRESPTSWSPDGSTLAFNSYGDIWVLNMNGNRTAEPLFATSFNERDARFSPDGRWITYSSNESGRHEIYVRPFPIREGKWLVSTDGGAQPMWAADGRELFYKHGNQLIVVDIETDPNFAPGKPRVLFEGSFLELDLNNADRYAVSLDGQRFLMTTTPPDDETAATPELRVVLNWTEELKRLVPPDN